MPCDYLSVRHLYILVVKELSSATKERSVLDVTNPFYRILVMYLKGTSSA